MDQVKVAPSLWACADISQWRGMYSDRAALLACPGKHHKSLLSNAYALHKSGLIDGDELSDLLEMADGALAFAVESLHGQDNEWV